MLKALKSPKITSNLVAGTVSTLREISIYNSARLLWVPGHFGVDGNEISDLLAKQATHIEFVGPEPAVGITATTVRTEVRAWASKEHLKHWNATPACRQAKVLSEGPNWKLTRTALRLNRREIKFLVGLLTGHTIINRHLSIMGIRTDPLCSACGEKEETLHFLGRCPARMHDRNTTLGGYTLDLEELSEVKPKSLIWFTRTMHKEVIVTYGYIGDAHWAE